MAIEKGPLSGFRVIDMSQAHAGPFGTMLLGDLGAEIIKLEPPNGELLRFGDPEVNVLNYYILSLNRNKKSLVLDIRGKLGKKAFHDLVKISDVVYSNFRADVPKRQGSDFDTIKEINPEIIRCNISGYGETGPYTKYPAFDIIACGHSGILSVSGTPDGGPLVPGGVAMADMTGGIFATMSVLAALINRDRDGKGATVDASLLNSLMIMQKVIFQKYFATEELPGHQGGTHHTMPTYGIFPTKDGFITLGLITDQDTFLELVGLGWMLKDSKFDSLLNRIVNINEFREHFVKALEKKNTDEWVRIFRDEHDMPSGPVLDYDQVVDDPQVLHNDMIKEMEVKGDKYKTINSVFKMPGVIEGEHDPAPDLGAHTEEILKNLLGYSDDLVRDLLAENEAAKSKFQNR